MKPWFIFIFFVLTACNVFILEDKKEIIGEIEVIITEKNPALYIVKKRLESRFNSSGKKEKEYSLVLSLASSLEQKNSGSDAFSSIFEINVNVNFNLKRITDGKIIDSGSISGKSIYISSRSKLLSEYMQEKQITGNTAEFIADEIFEKIQNSLYNTIQSK